MGEWGEKGRSNLKKKEKKVLSNKEENTGHCFN